LNATLEVNRFTKTIDPDTSRADEIEHNTLGVERELRRFAMNEYLEKKNRGIYVDDDHIPEGDQMDDDLLLTNAVTENTTQDEIDKTRYLKETKSFINVTSAARCKARPVMHHDAVNHQGFGESLISSDNFYANSHIFAPFIIHIHPDIPSDVTIHIDVASNHMQFQLIDITDPLTPIQIISSLNHSHFDLFIPIKSAYTLIDLAQTIMMTANNYLFQTAGGQLFNSAEPRHIFMVEAYVDPFVNPDRVTIKITCQPNYKFTWTFFVCPSPLMKHAHCDDIFPNPNGFIIHLNTAYLNVKSIRVISSQMPKTGRIINLLNNGIRFRLIDKNKPSQNQNIRTKDGKIDWTFFICPGDYTASELAAELELNINNMIFGEAGLSNIFTITANEKKNIFEINTTSPIAFYWEFFFNPAIRSRNLYQMLGFKENISSLIGDSLGYVTTFSNLIPKNPIIPLGFSPSTAVIYEPFAAFNLRKDRILWLQLNDYETIYDTLTQNKYFAMFNLVDDDDDDRCDRFVVDSFSPTAQVFVSSPLPYLSKLEIKFFDENGLPFDFNGIDHLFTLEIVHHLDRFMGSDYSSRRGISDKTSYI
jgi:hypothetical protein